MPLIKRLLVNLALTVGALALAFLVGEVAVRLLYKDTTVLYPRYHTDYRYGPYTIRGIRPSSEFWHTSVDGSWKFVTNDHGFRDARNFPYARPAGKLRVLSIGDSHTQGYEVRQDQTFSAVLERFLDSHGRPAEVINAGVSGFSTAEELVFLENEGIRYAPDAVVVGFFANDFEDNLKAGLFDLGPDGALRERKHAHLPGVRIQNLIYALPPIRWLGEHSYFYSLLFNNVWDFFKAQLAERARRAEPGHAASDEREYAIPTTAVRSDYDIALAAALLERMRRVCDEHGIRLIIVDIPTDTGAYRFASSIPPKLLAMLRRGGFEIVESESLFAGLNGAAEIHVPHGHHHISSLAHALIGAELGRRLMTSRPPRAK